MTPPRTDHDTPAAAERALGITWEDPPARSRGRASLPWRTFAMVLRRKPGVWARVHTYPSTSGALSSARRQAAGAYPDCPPDEYEFKAVQNPDGKKGSALYGRYLGDVRG